jgi:LacI family transcriptional regulator
VLADLEVLKAKSIPVVSVGAYCSRKTDSVRVDLLSGTMEAMEHLIQSGFRRIAHATFVRKDASHESRRDGYVRAMREAGLKTEFIYYPLTERQRPITRKLIHDYIRDHGRPEAIFSHSDDAALGIYRGLCDLGVRVPDEVALVGCDGIEDTEYLSCPLTTLAQPVPAMCATAWLFLQQRLEQPSIARQHAVLKPELALRESSRRPSN